MSDRDKITGNHDTLFRAMRFRINIGVVPQQFDVEGYICPNINCPCKEIKLYFYDANGRFDKKLFSTTLNYETWHLKSTEIFGGQEDYPKIIHEFMAELDDELKSFILSEKDIALANREDSLREDIDYSDIDINTLVYYSEIYRSAYAQFTFVFEDTEYFVMDYYCANPRCNCMDVLLTFMVIKDQRALDVAVLEIRTDFKAKGHLVEKKDRNITKEYAELLYKNFLDTLGQKGINLLEERYFRIKNWGRECLQTRFNENTTSNAPIKLSRPKIGRNDPCPCGSGKKYKKCCGT